MLTRITRFVITAQFASAVFAQAPASQPMDRVLHFANTESDREFHETATNIRGITEIPQVSVDAAQRTLTLHGTAAQIAVAEWLLNQWDNSAPAQPPGNPAAHQYRVSSDDIVQVFHLAHTPTPKILQEMATDVRTIANIRRLFTYSESSIITVRGDASQLALAEWLVSQLDQPASQATRSAGSHEYRLPGAIDDVVRVFYLANAGTPQRLQEMAIDVRTTTDIRRLFTYQQSTALIARGTAAEIALAEWLVNELDQPPNQPHRTPAPHEYRPSGTGDDIVRIFFLTHAESPQRLKQIIDEIRSATHVMRMLPYTMSQEVILRGTAAQIALANRIITEQDR